MATIINGMTIQADWFKNVDSSGDFPRILTFIVDTPPITFQSNSVDLATLDDDGNLKIKGSLSDNEDI
jgi:hypothetical protein